MIKYLAVISFAVVAFFMTGSANQAKRGCQTVINYYPLLGRQFAEFLMSSRPTDDDYDKKFKHYSEEILRWHNEYCSCVKNRRPK